MAKAYCYRSGQLGFTNGLIPDGALPIRLDASEEEITKIKALSRLAYDNKTLLVPGIPEAENQHDAYEAFTRFVDVLNFPAHQPIARRRKSKGGR